jgi:CheY-like chemotaxis protein
MKRILIVDDEPELLRVMAIHFRSRGLEVFTAKDGVEGVSVFRHNEPIDFVLTDYQMPRMNGVVMCMDIQQIADPQPMMVMMSADPPEIPAYLKLNIRMFRKPVRTKEIDAAFSIGD